LVDIYGDVTVTTDYQNKKSIHKHLVVSLILKRLKTGCQWRELSIKEYFPNGEITWQGVYYYFNKWSSDGSWKLIAEAGASFLYIIILPFIWLLYAQGTKRCHDLGKSGWWQLIPFYVLFLIFQPGTGELNEYGYPPRRSKDDKGMSLESEIQSIGK